VLLRAACAWNTALHGPVPPSITQLVNLEVLSLESNSFSGRLPDDMCETMRALKVRE
jgi:hypothetical protein